MSKEPILVVEDLQQYFKVSRKFTVKAVDGISFKIYPGETYGLVGESGSGKSTTGRSVIRLYKPTSGSIVFNGKEIGGKLNKETSKELHTKMQMIFQDPYASLNPRMTVEDIIAEGLDIHHLVKNKAERTERVEELLETVGLNASHASRFPHEFSGGQRQRIGIARAFLHDSPLLLLDEPTSNLDSLNEGIILKSLKEDKANRTVVLVSHRTSTMKVADVVYEMENGRVS